MTQIKAGLLALFIVGCFVFFAPNADATFEEHLIVGYGDGRIERLSVAPTEVPSVVWRATQDPRVMFIEHEYTYVLAAIPNDAEWSSQLTLPVIGVADAWNNETGSSSITVAVLDSGVDSTHEDLDGRVHGGWDFVDNDSDANPDYGTSLAAHHGTLIAGIIGAEGNNSQGIAGINWNVNILPVRVLNETGVGTSYDVAQGIVYAADQGADVINLSFIGDSNSIAIQQAIQAARNRGAVVVAAAGNDNVNVNTQPKYPVCNVGVIGVASLNTSSVKSSFSNYGSNCVDVSAPGESVFSTHATGSGSTLSGKYSGGWSGSSFATPHVTGVAALAKAYDPDITREQLETLLTSVAVTSIDAQNPSFGSHLGAGQISASRAVNFSSPPIVSGATVLTLPLEGGGPHLRGFTASESPYLNTFVEGTAYRGGGSIAGADIDGDGVREIIYGLGTGTSSRVRIFSHSGSFIKEFLAFSAPQNGIRVAGGDTNGDGKDEIIVVREQGATSDIRIFNEQGVITKRFFSYPQQFQGGMTVAAGDVTGDGIDEVIVGTGATGLPRVQVFTEDGVKLHEFFAYGLGYRGGINVASGDFDADGVDEIVTAPIRHGGPHVRSFEADGTFIGDFFAYGTGFHGGVSISSDDLNGDGYDDIITGARRGGGPHIRVWGNPNGTFRIADFFAYSEQFKGGVDVLGFTAVK